MLVNASSILVSSHKTLIYSRCFTPSMESKCTITNSGYKCKGNVLLSVPLFFFFFLKQVKETEAAVNNSCSDAVGVPYVSELWVTLDLAAGRVLAAVRGSLLNSVTASSCAKSAQGRE